MILRMPLTLAIIPCLIVTVSGERYAIPQRELEEAVCLHPGMKRADRAGVRHRGLPVARPACCRSCGLGDVLSRPRPFTRGDQGGDPGRRARREHRSRPDRVHPGPAVCRPPVRTGGRRGARHRGDRRQADAPLDQAGRHLHRRDDHGRRPRRPDRRRGGDRRARPAELRVGRWRSSSAAWTRGSRHRRIACCCSRTGPHEQFAMPLLQIRRIEMVGRDRIERVGEHEYVTVDGVSMRILRLDKVMNVSAPERPRRVASQMSADPAEVRGSGDGDPGVADRGHRIIVGRACRNIRNRTKAFWARRSFAAGMTLFLDIHRLSQKMYRHSRRPASGGERLPRSGPGGCS